MVFSGDGNMSSHYEFNTHAASLGVTLSEQQILQLIDYGNELELINKSMNLTRIPASEYLTMHVLDSLMIAKVGDLSNAKSLLDIGTGAGFPAIPLAIAFPNLEVIAMDARNKKLNFIAETAAKLGIKNISVQHARAEQMALDPKRRMFDLVTSRALANYATLLEWQLPFVKRSGLAIMMKSTGQAEEIGAAPKGWTQRVERLLLPGTEVERLLVILQPS